MGVFSDGSYDTPVGVMFSFPVTIVDQKWSIVQGLKMDDFAKEKLAATGKVNFIFQFSRKKIQFVNFTKFLFYFPGTVRRKRRGYGSM